MLAAHLHDDEHISMDIVWMVIDKLREAILLAKEHDIEGEAQACHYTANVYERIIQMAEVAYIYHLRCVTLAQTMIPRILTGVDWYTTSSTFVQKYRERKACEEEAIDEKLMNQLRTEMASELIELDNTAKKGTHDFLEHIYKVHPPRKEGATMGPLDANQLSKTVKKALLHYHPDKQVAEDDANARNSDQFRAGSAKLHLDKSSQSWILKAANNTPVNVHTLYNTKTYDDALRKEQYQLGDIVGRKIDKVDRTTLQATSEEQLLQVRYFKFFPREHLYLQIILFQFM
ncbi:unnamed protein product [Didymodactylos carnosus]|uniref:J domain-containing protein n=1 Tax=Didymodactylos carnosus TaxID=1234261 RepID=A0A8S2NWB1_9BILA|nr:unnamed protein product [Didymodactylos carnosus]CAF4021646.1 unnamed protein product [Didymodactylos carnosus]